MKTDNYPNWLVSIETAKKLKEIGFDKPTQNRTLISALESKRYKEENKIWSSEYVLKEGYYNSNETKDGLSIPTCEQVLEWFREKGLYGIVLVDGTYPYSDIEAFSFEIMKKNRDVVYNSEDDSTDVFNSYEEAREALVNKLIEIYEDK